MKRGSEKAFASHRFRTSPTDSCREKCDHVQWHSCVESRLKSSSLGHELTTAGTCQGLIMYIAFALFLLLHGFAHLVGFAGPWGLATSLSPQTTLLAGRISTGPVALRVLGVIWLGGSLAFTLAAVGVLRHAAWWPSFTFGAAVASLLLCIVSLPESKIGIPVNIAIIAAVLLTHADVVSR